uniref:Guanine nucleotide exchange factor Cdc24 n=1 Tax=Ganoderma boninense TaxID=34458 RepID=A0A5K1JYN4_9APHY|nr:Guanine nucleotide exchange factor Cdc24 [Ganoderma boninense]
MSFPPALDPPSTSAYLAVLPRHSSFPPAYEDREISMPCPESPMNVSPSPTMYQRQGWSTDGGSSGSGGGVIGMVRPISFPPQFHGQPAVPLPLHPPGEPAYPSMPYVASSTHGNAPAPNPSATYVAPNTATYAPSRDRAAGDGASTTRMGSGSASARGRRRPPSRRTSTNPDQPPTSTTARYKPYPRDGLQQPQNPMPALRRSQVRAGQLERVPAAPAHAYSVPAGPSWASTSISLLEEQREAGVAIPPGYYITPHGQPEATPRGANFVYPCPTEVATYSDVPRAVLDQTRTAPIWTSGPSSSASPSSSSRFFSGAPVSDSVVTAASQLPPPAVYGVPWSPADADVGSAQAQLRAMMMDELYNGGNMNGGGPSGSQPRRP